MGSCCPCLKSKKNIEQSLQGQSHPRSKIFAKVQELPNPSPQNGDALNRIIPIEKKKVAKKKPRLKKEKLVYQKDMNAADMAPAAKDHPDGTKKKTKRKKRIMQDSEEPPENQNLTQKLKEKFDKVLPGLSFLPQSKEIPIECPKPQYKLSMREIPLEATFPADKPAIFTEFNRWEAGKSAFSAVKVRSRSATPQEKISSDFKRNSFDKPNKEGSSSYGALGSNEKNLIINTVKKEEWLADLEKQGLITKEQLNRSLTPKTLLKKDSKEVKETKDTAGQTPEKAPSLKSTQTKKTIIKVEHTDKSKPIVMEMVVAKSETKLDKDLKISRNKSPFARTSGSFINSGSQGSGNGANPGGMIFGPSAIATPNSQFVVGYPSKSLGRSAPPNLLSHSTNKTNFVLPKNTNSKTKKNKFWEKMRKRNKTDTEVDIKISYVDFKAGIPEEPIKAEKAAQTLNLSDRFLCPPEDNPPNVSINVPSSNVSPRPPGKSIIIQKPLDLLLESENTTTPQKASQGEVQTRKQSDEKKLSEPEASSPQNSKSPAAIAEALQKKLNSPMINVQRFLGNNTNVVNSSSIAAISEQYSEENREEESSVSQISMGPVNENPQNKLLGMTKRNKTALDWTGGANKPFGNWNQD